MKQTGTWDKMPLRDKDAIIHDKGTATLINELNQVGKEWYRYNCS